MAGEELWKNPEEWPEQERRWRNVIWQERRESAYAELPRYFKDTKKVQDLESRLMTCMSTLQGIPEEAIAAKPFSSEQKKSDISSLATYVVGQSKGIKMTVP